MRIALRIAGVLAQSNPYGIMKGNYKEKRFDVLARSNPYGIITGNYKEKRFDVLAREENQHAGNAKIYPWYSGPRRRQEQPDGTEQGLNGISEPQILRQNL